jgi:hypothetical protein
MADPKIKWSAPLVRKQFLEFFEKKGHTIGMWRGSCSQDAFFPVWDRATGTHYAVFSLFSGDLKLTYELLQCPLPRWYPTMTQPSSSRMLG